jgi:hypothetical protein
VNKEIEKLAFAAFRRKPLYYLFTSVLLYTPPNFFAKVWRGKKISVRQMFERSTANGGEAGTSVV